ncbi:MAG TPA: Hpt domain-containing protein, partial [Phycisphaerales bacterium]|nr:Hpt domain-containing protein [Phycisphaerales bacterium]
KDIGAIIDDKAIFSDLQDQPDMADLLKDYVNQVNQSAVKLEQSITANQLDAVRALVVSIKGSAGNHGFKALANTASTALKALDASSSIAKASTELRSLAILCNSVTVR